MTKETATQLTAVSNQNTGRWAWASLSIGTLGLVLMAGLGWLGAHHPEVTLLNAALPLIGMYAVFLVGFGVLGRYGNKNAYLALACLLVAFINMTVFGRTSLPVQDILSRLGGMIGTTMVSAATFVFFVAFFLLVATTTALVRAFKTTEPYSRSRILALVVTDLIALLIVVF